MLIGRGGSQPTVAQLTSPPDRGVRRAALRSSRSRTIVGKMPASSVVASGDSHRDAIAKPTSRPRYLGIRPGGCCSSAVGLCGLVERRVARNPAVSSSVMYLEQSPRCASLEWCSELDHMAIRVGDIRKQLPVRMLAAPNQPAAGPLHLADGPVRGRPPRRGGSRSARSRPRRLACRPERRSVAV